MLPLLPTLSIRSSSVKATKEPLDNNHTASECHHPANLSWKAAMLIGGAATGKPPSGAPSGDPPHGDTGGGAGLADGVGAGKLRKMSSAASRIFWKSSPPYTWTPASLKLLHCCIKWANISDGK